MNTPLSIKETAKIRNWADKRIRFLIHNGLPTVKIGRQDLIYPDTLDAYLRDLEKPRSARSAAEPQHEGPPTTPAPLSRRSPVGVQEQAGNQKNG